jgi:ubiquinone/menaquinone biosynthesis C-methylase UbiE
MILPREGINEPQGHIEDRDSRSSSLSVFLWFVKSSGGNMAGQRERFDGIAPHYDTIFDRLERRVMRRWRTRVWREVCGGSVLEVGVGTGYNTPYYPAGACVAAVDVSLRMLFRTRAKLVGRGMAVPALAQMDVQHLAFADGSFDCAVATLVFCGVPDPIQGLRELARVVRPGGRVILLEHMRAQSRPLARLMDFLNPVAWWIIGEDMNRDTVANVRAAGLSVLKNESRWANGIVRMIIAEVA